MKETEKNTEKIVAGEVVIRSRFLTWLDNFWYHYKWHVIVIAFFVMIGLIGFTQCVTQNRNDVIVTYAGGYTLSAEERENVLDVFRVIAPEREDGEGRLSVGLNLYSIYTEEELREMATDPDTGEYSAYSFNSAKQTNLNYIEEFSDYILTGDSAVWLVSEYVYQLRALDTRSVPLDELFDTAPQGAYDACAIRLADTELYQYYDALKVLPEDTLILFPRSTFMGASANEETYAKFLQIYKAIVMFEDPSN